MFVRLANGYPTEELVFVLYWCELGFITPFLLGIIFSHTRYTFLLQVLPGEQCHYCFTFQDFPPPVRPLIYPWDCPGFLDL